VPGGVAGSGGYGAGLSGMNALSLRVADTLIIDNVTGPGGNGGSIAGSGGFGGGLALQSVDDVIIVRSTIDGNSTGAPGTGGLSGVVGFGGGLFATPATTLIVANSTLRHNDAANGAGMYTTSFGSTPGRVELVNTLMHDNVASLASGGAIEFHSNGYTGLVIVNCTIVGNSAPTLGGGLHYAGHDDAVSEPARLSNSILWNNTASMSPQLSSLNAAGVPNFVPLEVDANDIMGGCAAAFAQWTCGANLDVDPLFTNAAADMYTLQAGSTIKNAGDDAHLPVDAADVDDDNDTAEVLPIDLAGNLRIADTSVGQGAFEAP
jgi:hypothetical protein